MNWSSQNWIETDGEDCPVADDKKPPYRVPAMAEIREIPWCGYRVVSSFSGAGGSCLGFRMAGFKTVWASEFVPAAAEVYRLNHPGVPLNTRDIRKVTPAQVLEEAGLLVGEADVMEGSPPCASFSTAGKREAHWGEVRKYSDTKQRTDDLFFEFVRILEGVRPRVFVAENVSGLVKGKAKGYFKEILARMKGCGYVVRAKLLDAQWLGVPQTRQRIIFVGVREDLGAAPAHPSPLAFRYSVRDAIPWIVRYGTAPCHDDWVRSKRDVDEFMVDSGAGSCPTIVQSGVNKGTGLDEARPVQVEGGDWATKELSGRPAPTVRQSKVNLFMERESHGWFPGGTVDMEKTPAPTVPTGPGMAGYAGHALVMVDPDTGEKISIEGTVIGREWDNLEIGESSDRYYNLRRVAVDGPSSTVTQMGGHLGAAAVTHPVEKRKFTIAELKRICAFSDDFVLTGTYAQRWERLGRAVPPIMMWHVAREVRGILERLDGREPWEHDPPCLLETLR